MPPLGFEAAPHDRLEHYLDTIADTSYPDLVRHHIAEVWLLFTDANTTPATACDYFIADLHGYGAPDPLPHEVHTCYQNIVEDGHYTTHEELRQRLRHRVADELDEFPYNFDERVEHHLFNPRPHYIADDWANIRGEPADAIQDRVETFERNFVKNFPSHSSYLETIYKQTKAEATGLAESYHDLFQVELEKFVHVLRRGATPAAAIDYYTTQVTDWEDRAWAAVRGTDLDTIHDHQATVHDVLTPADATEPELVLPTVDGSVSRQSSILHS